MLARSRGGQWTQCFLKIITNHFCVPFCIFVCQGRESSLDSIASLSLSYCEGVSPGRGGGGYRPLSAPPRPAPPHSPRVLELVEKSESVAWKLVSASCTV